MEKRNGFFKSMFEGFTMSSVQVANSSSMIKNPIDEALKPLYSGPSKARAKDIDYVKFGTNDDIPVILQTLLNKSSTHAGIVHKKAKMVAGQQLIYNNVPQRGTEKIAFQVLTENAGGSNVSLDAVFKKAAFYYELQGAVGFRVKLKGKELISVNAVSPLNMRALPPVDNKITQWLIRHTFKYATGNIWKNEEEVVDVYDPRNIKDDMIIYIRNPHSTNEFYGTPNYISAFNFIEADYEFGVMIKNSAENGFSPKVLATLIGRNLSDDQKREQAAKLKSNFQGSDAEQMIVSWVRKPEEAPQFLPLDVSNLDKTIDVMANLNDAKILTAHSVVNPSLFGVQVAGKLGNSGTEMDMAYNIFRATETIPTRELLINALNLVFRNSKWEKITAEVEDFPIMTEDQTDVVEEDTETVIEE